MDALEERGAQVVLVHTGHHYGPAMRDVYFDDLGIRRPGPLRRRGFGQPCCADRPGAMAAFEPVAFEQPLTWWSWWAT
jgi:UDP-N-acetylglucosamine 2-epimerase (non-hydrolysing)